MSFFQKLCPAPVPPVSCSFHEPHLGPQYCVYNLLEGQPEDNWPWGGKYCIVSNPSRESGLHLPCFLHVWQQRLSVDLLGWVTGTQYLPEVHLLVASLQGQLGFQGQCLSLWELALQAVWAQILIILLLKLQTYPQIKSPLHFYGTYGLLPIINLSLSHLLTPTTRTLPLCRQHRSTKLIIKIFLMHLTGTDNPLICNYFCYYLKWVYYNEMFTIGNTLNCSYWGLEEEIILSQSYKRIRLMAILPGSVTGHTGLDCFTSRYLFPSVVEKLAMS